MRTTIAQITNLAMNPRAESEVATAASAAFPPASSISSPARLAVTWSAATTPPVHTSPPAALPAIPIARRTGAIRPASVLVMISPLRALRRRAPIPGAEKGGKLVKSSPKERSPKR